MNFPAEHVLVRDEHYRAAHGKRPRGRGVWIFTEHPTIHEAITYVGQASMLYGEAREHAKTYFAAKGIGVIHVAT
jgi:hypothetical protein